MQEMKFDSIDLKLLQNIYADSNMKTTCSELKIGHSTYSRHIKKLLKGLNLSSFQQLRMWIAVNFSC